MAKKVSLLCVLWIVAILALPAASQNTSVETPASASPTKITASSSTILRTPAPPPSASTVTGESPSVATPVSSSAASPSLTSSGSPATGSATTATTKPPNPCESNPCLDGSTCEPRGNQSFVCLCLLGETYNDDIQTCEKAQVFPGKLSLTSIDYKEEMRDKTSEAFKHASLIITTVINGVFTNDTYSKSTVMELRPSGSSKGWLLRTGGVDASIEIIFEANSGVTDEQVKNMMTKAVTSTDCKLCGSFESTDMCSGDPCDSSSTTCTSQDGSFTCACKDGFFSSPFSDRICQACPQGEKYEDSTCVPCQYGYSGLNCQESWKLILIIVGSVLGALLLITIILLAVGASKSRVVKSKKKKNEDFGKPYVSHSAAKAPLVNSSNNYAAPVNGSANGQVANVGVPRIPRATTTNSWDSRTNLEMTPSNSRHNLVPGGRNMRLNDDQDDMFPYAQSNSYTQSRPQNSIHAQNRASVNPYSQGQGHSNPYYVPDDRGRFN